MKFLVCAALCAIFATSAAYVDYDGHKVITVTPKTENQLELLYNLRDKYFADLWNEPNNVGVPVMIRLSPDIIETVEQILKKNGVEYESTFSNLQRRIMKERIHCLQKRSSEPYQFNFTKYHKYEEVLELLGELSSKYADLAKLEIIGTSYENRSLYNMKISSGDSSSKPAILIECGIHAREWSSVAVCSYVINKLLTTYGEDPEITTLVDEYEFNIINVLNPDGYIYSWEEDRLWRKTRSRSNNDASCYGTDPNRNFDIDFGGPGSSKNPCEQNYIGDSAFSESETRALRDLMLYLKDRLKLYYSLHAFSQLWMMPFGNKESLPPNYDELMRIAKIGADALEDEYGTSYEVGPVSKIIYEASGDSIDYAYEKMGIKLPFALELRDRGKVGFFLHAKDILPMCEETWSGIKATIQAL